MNLELARHPDTPCEAVDRIAVEVERPRPGALSLLYRLSGSLEAIRLPALGPMGRGDELWRTTCLEAFVGPADEDAYYEFNFAPSSRWASYRFDRYREGMKPATELGAPRINIRSNARVLAMQLLQDLSPLAEQPWRLGLSAVIEEADGRVSYWALAHPRGRPDFHHPDCFAAELRAPHGP